MKRILILLLTALLAGMQHVVVQNRKQRIDDRIWVQATPIESQPPEGKMTMPSVSRNL